MQQRIAQILAATAPREGITVRGWVRTRRDNKGFSFVEINDGSSLKNLQAIVDVDAEGYGDIEQATTGASVSIVGDLVESPAKGQAWELKASRIQILGTADASYPLQKKGHSPEFLREIAHLRPRSNLFGAIFRTRSRTALAIHKFFDERQFAWVHTPIITASDCEGAGELFRATTFDPAQAPTRDGATDWSADFFERPTYLTVSGQLQAEIFATALGLVYTFGPTFRAEDSNTSRHAAEFWMIEPEMAFFDLEDDMDLGEALVKHLVRDQLENGGDDLGLFARFVDKGLRDRLEFVADRPFERLSYRDAVATLEASGRKFEHPVAFGQNLQSEHERWLTEEHVKAPLTIHDYPKTIKPFYMRANDDGDTVAAMDVLVPGIGEIIGGSQREERLDILEANLRHHGLDTQTYDWYLDLRRFGTVPHSGFGMGFERVLMFLTGVSNIRDVLPFPRTPGHCAF
jgi:asparaginyl-tRNA synthetase